MDMLKIISDTIPERNKKHSSISRGFYFPRDELFWFSIYCTFVLVVWTIAQEHPKHESTAVFFATIGAIAAWRYSWWTVHQIRAFIFLKFRFPRLRRLADEVGRTHKLDHLFVIVMSYKIDPHEFTEVYTALIKNAIAYGAPTTIIASVTSHDDRLRLSRIFADSGNPSNIEIVVQFQRGDGKRSAMGMALRAVSRRAPPENSLTIFMDGDVLLEADTIARSVPFFIQNPKLAGATTNNGAIVDGGHVTRNWYILRHAQRNALMSSMALSHRLLVLTGRYSIIRTRYAIEKSFIERVESDSLSHWRHGRFRFVSGDDKSTWYHLMTRNAELLYIPDVMTYGFESLPERDKFFKCSTQLMIRWFGNMLRTSGRAIALGPVKCGPFVWWSLIDQRISIWTSLVGPSTTILFSLLVSPIYIAYYFAWVAVTRTIMSVAAGIAYREFSFSWPFVMYYNQVWGSFLKTYLGFRLNRQGWTRQKIGRKSGISRLESLTNTAMHVSALMVMLTSVGLLTGVLKFPDRSVLHAITYISNLQ